MIKLSNEQNQAIELIKKFINNKEIACSLTGSAGTGKSTVIANIIQYLESNFIRYCLCAPTHKAKTVVEYYTHRDAITLHKLLALSPRLDIFDLDFNNLLFQSRSSKEIPKNGVVICDEGSMINDDLFDLLIKRCKEKDAKIIFVSDSKQLAPVKSNKLSKVYELPKQISLTKIFRQSDKNAILGVLQELREHEIEHFDTCKGEDGSLICESDFNIFFQSCKDGIYKAIKNQDIFEAKIAAFTNKRVNKYNEFLTKYLFGDSEEYYKLEILTGNENINFNGYDFFNSMDYFIKDVQPIDLKIPNYSTLPGFKLILQDSDESCSINILSNKLEEEIYSNLAYIIESLRLEALEAKSKYIQSKCWKQYFNTINSFASPKDLYFDNRLIRSKTFSKGYAVTVHRLQGSTLNNIYIDMKDINSCRDEEMRRQLQYVALSRARHNVYLYQ